MKSFVYTFLLSLTLSACAIGQSPKTLSEKLSDAKTPEEKQEVLRLACLNEAEWSEDQKKKKHRLHRHHFNSYLNSTEETRRLKTLCREMTENYVTAEKE